MKKNLILMTVMCVFALSVSISAQKTADFSGKWNLDLTKSKLSDREKSPIESQTLTVTQTAAELKVETATKRNAPPAGAPQGGPPPGGMPAGGPPPGGNGGGRGGMGGGMMGGDGTATYKLDGKDVTSEIQSPMGSMTMVTKAKIDGDKFKITRTTQTPMGDRVSTEKWSLGADGKTLTIESERPNRDGGTDTTTKVFNKG